MDEWILKQDERFRYQLLSRMQTDCDYYLSYEHGCAKQLWANNEIDQIYYMKLLWNSFPNDKKPEWLTWEQLLEYEKKMCTNSCIDNL